MEICCPSRKMSRHLPPARRALFAEKSRKNMADGVVFLLTLAITLHPVTSEAPETTNEKERPSSVYTAAFLDWSSSQPLSARLSCPEGWFINGAGTDCYQLFVLRDLDRQEALDHCRGLRAELVQTPQRRKAEWLATKVTETMGMVDVWAGIKRMIDDETQQLRWFWDEGHVMFSGGVDEPISENFDSEPESGLDCAVLTSSGHLFGKPCEDRHIFVCSRSLSIPVFCDDVNGWKPFLGHCYKTIDEENDWDGAKRACEAESAGMVIIDSLQENVHIGDFAASSGKDLWLSLVQAANGEIDYIWQMTNEENHTVEISHQWMDGEPEYYDGEVGAGFMASDGNAKWGTAPRFVKKGTVCEKAESKCVSGWAEGVDDKCYFLDFSRTVNRDLNRGICSEMGTQTLLVGSPAQDLFLVYALDPFSGGDQPYGLWLGLEETVVDGNAHYAWDNGEELNPHEQHNNIAEPDLVTRSCFTLSRSFASELRPFRDELNASDDTDSFSKGAGMIHQATTLDSPLSKGNLKPSWVRTSCTDAENYPACENPVGASITLPPEVQYSCPDDSWQLMFSYCYRTVDGEYSWAAGEKTCQKVNAGAHLVSIYSPVEEGFVFELVQQRGDVWIGYNDRNQEGHWVWSDGGQVHFENWADDDDRSASCATMQAADGRWHVDDCTNLRGIMCKMSADKDHHVEPPVTDVWSVNCGGAGWKEDPQTGKCYKMVPERYSWYAADENCKAEGAQLLSVNSFEEQSFINAWAAVANWEWWNLWAGGQDEGSESGWRWSDGSPFMFIYWQDGQPDNYNDLEDCLHLLFLQGAIGQWNDRNCNEEWGSICEKPGSNAVTPAPPGWPMVTCPKGWVEFEGNCYKVESNNRMSWDAARQHCQTTDPPSDLAVIHSRAENDFVRSHFQFSSWLGLREVNKNNSWYEWVDGSGMDFDDFPDGEPNDPNEECVELRYEPSLPGKHGRWNDKQCHVEFGFVCELEPRVCPEGFEYFNGNCYWFSTEMAPTRGQAAFLCIGFNERYSKLVSINNGYDNSYVRENLGRGDSFIGILREDIVPTSHGLDSRERRGGTNGTSDGALKRQESSWIWDDGTPVGPYSNWAPGEPQTGDDAESYTCAKMDRRTGMWYSTPCMTEAHYVCEFHPTHVYGCPAEWEDTGDTCFQFVEDGKVWPDAQADCRRRGGDLAAVLTPRDQEYLASMIGSNPDLPTCPPEWLQYGDSCYGFYGIANNNSGVRVYDEARAICQSSGLLRSDLVYIPDSATYNFLKEHVLVETEYYLGMDRRSDPNHERWQWAVDGSQVDFTEWDQGEPAPEEGTVADCAFIHPATRKWRVTQCDSQLSFICEGKSNKRAANRWIGLSDRERENTFGWSSHDAVTFSAWAPDMPQKHAGDKLDCVITKYATNAQWANVACDYTLPYVCSRSLGIEPVPSGDLGCDLLNDLGYEASCYSYLLNGVSQELAQSDVCQRNNRQLATINDRNENSRLASWLAEFPSSRFWLGLQRNSDMNFEWASGEHLTFTNWGDGQPTTGSGNCVYMSTYPEHLGQWYVSDCRDDGIFPVCEGQREGFTKPLPPQTTPLADACPEGWKFYSGQCYKLYRFNQDHQVTWNEARQFCRSLSSTGELASFFTTYEESLLFDLTNPDITQNTGRAWIGFFNEDGWEWVDGSAVNLVHWKTHEPPDPSSPEGERERCAAWDATGGTFGWVAFPCETTKANFACEMRAGTGAVTAATNPTIVPLMACSSEFPEWYYLNKNCYFVAASDVNGDFSRSWHDARAWCRSQHLTAELVSIHDHQEQALLTQLVQMHPSIYAFYIGLKRDGLTNAFQWSDGSIFGGYVYWSYGEPNDWLEQEGCAEMLTSTGYWNDRNCGGKTGGFICKLCRDECEGRTPPATTPLPPGFCSEGWVYFHGRCYKYFTRTDEESNWDISRVWCEDEGPGSHLVSVHSVVENAFLHTMLYVDAAESTEPSWIGLHDMYGDTFQWSDESTIDYTNWAVGEPQNQGEPGEDGNPIPLDCAAIERTTGRWYTASCGSSGKGYVCKRHPDAGITEEGPRPMCEGDFSSFFKFAGNCYLPINEALSWDEAERRCFEGLGLEDTHLASINDLLSLHYMSATGAGRFGMNFWIGLQFNQDSGTYRWSDGVSVHLTNWAGGQPPGIPADGEDCVIMDHSTTQWSVAACSQMSPFICKHSLQNPIVPIITGRCPDGSWLDFGGEHCFRFFFDQHVAWGEAERSCKEQGASLASMHSEEDAEHIYLAAVESLKNFWIGMTMNSEGVLAWSDGSAVDFENWNAGEPNMADEKCVEILHEADYKWNDAYCTSGKPYICKAKKQPFGTLPPNSSMAPTEASTVVRTNFPITTLKWTHQPLPTTVYEEEGSSHHTTTGNLHGTTAEGSVHHGDATKEGLSGGAVAAIIIVMLLVFAAIGYLSLTVLYQPERLAAWRVRISNAADGLVSSMTGRTREFIFPSSASRYQRDYGGARETEDGNNEEKGGDDGPGGSGPNPSTSSSPGAMSAQALSKPAVPPAVPPRKADFATAGSYGASASVATDPFGIREQPLIGIEAGGSSASSSGGADAFGSLANLQEGSILGTSGDSLAFSSVNLLDHSGSNALL